MFVFSDHFISFYCGVQCTVGMQDMGDVEEKQRLVDRQKQVRQELADVNELLADIRRREKVVCAELRKYGKRLK
jgi:hypothetical protein